ncbi:uncharacterized protein LOC130511198 [Raphanus sativus]|uniref:Uncharacterized protein LOC130511198 n=1 Tax=Raphanus sativus TaxID=3726 RepID=A0A9W3DK37_RAPSA|nr:uncharacterized protein LOC130511198 [Raphanus sativus]
MEEEEHLHCNSPVVSQYAAQHYGQPSSKTVSSPLQPENTSTCPVTPVHNTPVHNSGEHTILLVHKSPEHTFPVHNSIEPTTTVRTTTLPSSPSGTPPWLESPKSPPRIYRSFIYEASEHPNSPPFHHLLNQGLEIFEPISPEVPSLNNPRYDTSTRRGSITPDTSPNKSSGFAEHAASVNAFAATATSKRTPIPICNFDQSQENTAEDYKENTGDDDQETPVEEDYVELSD